MKKEWAQLEQDIPNTDTIEKKSIGALEYDEVIEERNVWTSADQQLYDNDFGTVNEKVLDYNDKEYLLSGKNNVNWGQDTKDIPETISLPKDTRIIQYANPSDDGKPMKTGKYFAPEGTDYDDLQLPNAQDKRILAVYEVVDEMGLTVNRSEIAIQPWNQTDEAKSGTDNYQYVTSFNTEELLKQGKIRLVTPDSEYNKNQN